MSGPLYIDQIHVEKILTPHVLQYEQQSTAITTNGTLNLNVDSFTYQILTGSATGYSIVLPDATTVTPGLEFQFYNTTNNTIAVKNNSGTTLATIAQNTYMHIKLRANSTQDGVWDLWQILLSSIASGVINYTLSSSTAFNTTSTSYVQITGFSVTPQAGTYAIWYNAESFLTTTPKTHWWAIFRNGSIIQESERSQDTAHSNQNMVDATMCISTFNGSQSIDVRVKTTNGTLTINDRSLILIRLGT